jgi:carboxyl-terminal processing protease
MIAIAICFTLGPASAQTPPSSSEAPKHSRQASSPESLAGHLSQHPRWKDLLAKAQESALRAPDEVAALSSCGVAASAALAEQDRLDLCLAAALETFDDAGQYFNAAQTARRVKERSPHGSLGLELAQKAVGETVVIVSPIAGSPAQRAGIRAGDRIELIDGNDVRPLSMDEVLDALRQPALTTVKLRIRRDNDSFEVSAQTAAIKLPSVRALKASDSEVAVLRIGYFGPATPAELAGTLERVAGNAATSAPTSSAQRPRGLVIDLRTNRGGQLAGTVRTAALLSTPSTVVLRLVHRTGQERVLSGNDDGGSPGDRIVAGSTVQLSESIRQWLRTVPVVVLVDRYTASGANAFAAFAREELHATLVGSATSPSAIVTTAFALEGNTSVLLTTAEMRTAQGRPLISGIKPDIEAGDDGAEWGLPDDARVHRARELVLSMAKSLIARPD